MGCVAAGAAAGPPGAVAGAVGETVAIVKAGANVVEKVLAPADMNQLCDRPVCKRDLSEGELVVAKLANKAVVGVGADAKLGPGETLSEDQVKMIHSLAMFRVWHHQIQYCKLNIASLIAKKKDSTDLLASVPETELNNLYRSIEKVEALSITRKDKLIKVMKLHEETAEYCTRWETGLCTLGKEYGTPLLRLKNLASRLNVELDRAVPKEVVEYRKFQFKRMASDIDDLRKLVKRVDELEDELDDTKDYTKLIGEINKIMKSAGHNEAADSEVQKLLDEALSAATHNYLPNMQEADSKIAKTSTSLVEKADQIKVLSERYKKNSERLDQEMEKLADVQKKVEITKAQHDASDATSILSQAKIDLVTAEAQLKHAKDKKDVRFATLTEKKNNLKDRMDAADVDFFDKQKEKLSTQLAKEEKSIKLLHEEREKVAAQGAELLEKLASKKRSGQWVVSGNNSQIDETARELCRKLHAGHTDELFAYSTSRVGTYEEWWLTQTFEMKFVKDADAKETQAMFQEEFRERDVLLAEALQKAEREKAAILHQLEELSTADKPQHTPEELEDAKTKLETQHAEVMRDLEQLEIAFSTEETELKKKVVECEAEVKKLDQVSGQANAKRDEMLGKLASSFKNGQEWVKLSKEKDEESDKHRMELEKLVVAQAVLQTEHDTAQKQKALWEKRWNEAHKHLMDTWPKSASPQTQVYASMLMECTNSVMNIATQNFEEEARLGDIKAAFDRLEFSVTSPHPRFILSVLADVRALHKIVHTGHDGPMNIITALGRAKLVNFILPHLELKDVAHAPTWRRDTNNEQLPMIVD